RAGHRGPARAGGARRRARAGLEGLQLGGRQGRPEGVRREAQARLQGPVAATFDGDQWWSARGSEVIEAASSWSISAPARCAATSAPARDDACTRAPTVMNS